MFYPVTTIRKVKKMNDQQISERIWRNRRNFNRMREVKLGSMMFATEGDKVQFTYNDKIREGFIDYIWKNDVWFGGCYMTVNFRDGMEDVENSSYKNFSLNQVSDFEIIARGV